MMQLPIYSTCLFTLKFVEIQYTVDSWVEFIGCAKHKAEDGLYFALCVENNF